MDSIPEHRALLGLDVVGSARNAGYYLNLIPDAVDHMLRVALADCDIPRSEVTDWETTGDGALLTLPSRRLARLVDVSKRIDVLAADHNRWRKPDLRIRIAIELGPVGDRPGYYASKITHNRLLNASAFKSLLERCLQERPDGSVNTGLILSDHAYRCVFGGDHIDSLQRSDFTALPITDKEFTHSAWVLVPGYDPRSIGEFINELSPSTDNVTHAGGLQVHNEVGGSMRGVQTGIVNGGITFGGGRR